MTGSTRMVLPMLVFVGLLLQPSSAQSTPTVTIQQPSYSVTTGGSVTLVCTVTSNLAITNVQWQRNVNGFITTITSNTNTNKYSGSTTTTPSLTIFSASSSDVGTYICIASNVFGTSQSTTTQLSVTGTLPTVQVQQSSYSVNTGNTVTLVCTVSSNLPVTSVQWQRNVGGTITTINSNTNTNKYSGSTTSTPSLTIFNVQQSDAGTYTCFGSNSGGTGQSSTTLSVTTTGTVPTVQVQQSSYSVNTGNTVTLVCTVSSNLAITSVQWQRNIGGTITTINSNTNTNKYSGSTTTTPSLTIFSAQQSDVGTYTCFASNSVGTGQSTTTTLSVTVTGTVPTVQVQQTSYSVNTGNTVTLVCTVSSNLAITSVQWQRNIGGSITTINSNTNINKYSGSTTTTPSLTIFNAASSDAGTYTCFGSNSVGTGQSSTTLSVTGTVPTVQVQQTSYSVNTGNTVTLVCTVSSNLPITNVYWQRNIGGSITTINSNTNTNKYSGSTTTTPSLTIFSTSSSDVGTYTCFASSSVGTGQSTTTTLSVTGTVPTVQVQQSSYSVNTGNTVTLVCTVSSNLPVTSVQWQRNVGGTITTINSNINTNKYSGSTTTTPSLTIFSVQQSDAGTYTCFASNSVGTGQSTTTTLSVTGTVPTVQVQQTSYSVNTGNTVTLVCTVSSNLPITNVYWQRNIGGSITTINSNTNTNKYSGSTTTTPSLTIFSTSSSDVGTYTCFASSSVGTGQSTTTTLSVTGTVPTVQVQQSSYSVNTGNTVTLVCTVSSNLPVTSVQWQRNVGGTITTINSNINTNKYSGSTTTTPSLTIFSVQQSDAGTYTCFASNSVGTGQSTTTTLSVTGTVPTVQVQQSSYSVNTGNTVTLVCTVSSNLPVTNVYWQKNIGGTITSITSNTNTNKYSGSTTTTPSLTIFSAAQSDVGTYTCFASNSVGTGQSTTTIISVTIPGNPPTVQVQQSSYSVNTGNTVTLVCTVTSNLPITNVYWQRNIGGSITTIVTTNTNTNKYSGGTVNTPSLTIFSASSSDAGAYSCYGSNSVGTDQSSTTLSVTGDPPTVQVQQSSYSVNTGNTVTLVCTVSSSLPITNVYWQRNIGGSGTTITTTNTNKYSGSTTTTPSLTIFSVQQSDVGTYTCYGSNSVGTDQSSTTLSVTGNPPTVQVQQSSYSVNTGNTVTLVCTVSSSLPITNVYWQRNIGGSGTSITTTNTNKYSGSTTTTPSLTIFSVQQSDVGTYTCYGSNSVGTDQSSTTLSVTGNPPTVQVQQSSYSVNTGNTVTLVCTVSSSLPITNVYWQRNIGGSGTTITTTNTNKYSGSTSTTPSLTIFSVQQSDVGTYTCYGSNSVGTDQSSTTLSVTGNPPTVQVQQSSYSVNIGNTVTLVCTVSSSLPVTNVYWQRNIGGSGTTITTTNTNKYSGSTTTTPSLTIFSVQQSDVGTYTCYGSNSVGTDQSSTTLSVTGNPPTVQVQQSSYSVNTGNSVTLVCTVTSNLPITNVYWQRNIGGSGTTITTTNTNKYSGSTTTTPSLTIFSVEQSDVGTYTCYGSNSVGTDQSSTTLSVTGNPPTVQVQQSSYSVNTGNTVTLVCTVTSNLPITNVYWQKNIGGSTTRIITTNTNTNKYNGGTINTPSLTIYSVQQSDAGTYTCFGSNSVGTAQSSTTLGITGDPPTVQVQQSSYSVNTGNTVTLVCTVSSSLPITNVYWQRNIGGSGTTITTTNTNKYSGSTTTTPSLTIFSVQQSDVGTYTCYGSNSVGTDQSSTTLSVAGDPPTVQVQQSSYSVNTGNTVTLVCTVSSNLPITNVYWQRNIGGSTTRIITTNTNTNKYNGGTINTPSLTIYSVQQSDAGTYTCFGSNSVGTDQSATTLSITGDPPTVQVQQSSYSVNTGNTVTLVCTVSSSLPITNVYWQRNIGGSGTTITTTNTNKYSGSTTTTPSLTIFSVQQSDVGTYTCYGSNSVGTDQSSTTLSVTGDPPNVQVQQSSYSVNTGNTVTLVCTVTSNLPITNVYWQRNIGGSGTRIITTNTNTNKYNGGTINTPSLTIYSVQQSDAGTYTCFGSNSVGTGQSSTALGITGDPPTVQIQQSSYSVTTGNSVTFVCTVTSTLPITNVYWQRNIGGSTSNINGNANTGKYSGGTINTPSLTIYNADSSDAGTYTCSASNSVGTGQSTTTFSVTGNAPQVNILSSAYSVNVGSSVTLQCTVSANPVHTTVYWKKITNGVSTDVNVFTNSNKYGGSTVNSPSLIISNAVTSDEGFYVCYATNSVGTGQSSQTYLDVAGNVPVVNVLQLSYSTNIGSSITLRCTVTSNPTHNSVYWQRMINGQTSQITTSTNTNKYSGSTVNTPSLTINNVAQSDAGSYRCLADNSIGTGQSQITVLNVAGNVPSVVLSRNNYIVGYGDRVTIGCTVSSNPAHTSIYWQRIRNGVTQTITLSSNNKYSGSSVTTPSLTILNVDNNDEGDYICYAINSVGTGQSSRGTLEVTGSVPTVRVLQNTYSVQRGNPITLECEVTGTPSHTSVYWTKLVNSQSVTIQMIGTKYGGSSITSPSLIIFNAEASDEGAYICHATNSIGTGQSSQTNLNVDGYVPSVTASIVPSVTVGNSVVINCVVTADPQETAIVWQKVINGVRTTLSISSNNRYSGGTVNTPSLTIGNVQDSDEGLYICQATNSVGTGSSNQVSLDVIGEAPHLTYVTPSRLVVTEGELIYATCITTSNPEATFTWIKENSEGVFGTGDKLEITVSSRTDIGTYTCRARNSYGVDEVSLTVDVQYKPDVTISERTSTFSGTGGGSVNIPCSYVSNPSATSVSWRKIQNSATTTITINGNKYAGGGLYQSGLTIYDLEASDVASYQCVATNLVGTGESESIQLIVDTKSAPYDIVITPVHIDVAIGTSFSATCTAKGDPAPTYSWFFKDQMIQTGQQLSITGSATTDDGVYTCVATNSLGIRQANMDANVRYAPISTVTTTEFKRVLGDPVTLTCSTRANPSATEWTWTKDGNPLYNYYSDTYLVDMDSLQDLGTYTCVAKNNVGQSSIIEFHVKQGTAAQTYELVNVSKLTTAEIVAIVVSILLVIAITAVVIICCITRGWCRKKERVIVEVPEQKPVVKTTVKDPIYLKDINFHMVPRFNSIEYVQKEPQLVHYQPPKYLTQQSQYLPAIEYLPNYDDENRRRKLKSGRTDQIVLEERIIGGGDIYQTTNGISTGIQRDSGSIYRTVDNTSHKDVGDKYIEAVVQ